MKKLNLKVGDECYAKNFGSMPDIYTRVVITKIISKNKFEVEILNGGENAGKKYIATIKHIHEVRDFFHPVSPEYKPGRE